MFSRDEVHNALDNLLVRVEVKGSKQEQFTASLNTAWREGQSEALGQIKIFEAHKEVLKEEKKKYLMALANNPELKDDYLAVIAEVEQKISGVDTDIAAARDVDQDLIEFVEFAFNFIEHQSQEWWGLEFDDREKCKQLLFPAGFSINSEKRVYTPEISPLIRLKDTKTEPLNGPVDGVVEVAGVTPASKTAFVRVLHAQSQIIIDAQPEAANA